MGDRPDERVASTVETVEELAGLLRQLRRREARREGATPLTYRELALKTGWSRGVIGEYFVGRVLPPTDRFDVLIRLLGATPAEQGWLATARDRVEERRRSTPHVAEAAGDTFLSVRQLPPAAPGFAGRAGPLAELDRLLAPGSLIAAVTGTAGVGKTALVLHWAHRVASHFPDGQFYLNLRGFDPGGAPVPTTEAVRTLMEALGVPQHRIPTAAEAQAALYRGLLAERRALVVLDNARDAEHVRPLLPGGPACRVVVTSRSQLTGLISAEGAHPVPLDLLTADEAHILLAARMGATRLAAEPEAVEAIVESCSRLPLALAMVAARAALYPSFPLAALVAELRAAQGGLGAFAGGDPGSDIRAVFSWSYRWLGAAAARLFRLLALHPGPNASVAGLASLTAAPLAEVRMMAAELTHANLLAEPVPGRYAYHDLLRAYATELTHAVDSEPERQAASRRVVEHYLHAAHAADLRLDPHRDPIPLPPTLPGLYVEPVTDHATALAWFDVELTGLLAAAATARADRLDLHACRLARTMAHYLERRGHWHRWADLQEQTLAAALRLGDPDEIAHAHRSLGRVAVHLGQDDAALAHFDAALDGYRAAGDQAGQARIRFDLGWVAIRQGRAEDALARAREAYELFAAAGNRSGQGRALNTIGWCLTWLERHEEAADHCLRGLALLEEVGDRYGAAETWDSLAHAQHGLGRYREAAGSYARSYALWREMGNRYQEADMLVRMGENQSAAGDPAAARESWHQALEILDQLDHPDAERLKARLGS